MNYGFTITSAGWRLLTGLLAGETLELTRIMVGKGKVADDVNPADLQELVSPVAQATSTVPIVADKNISFIVEYRSDMNGGIEEGFWINEFGIFALDKDQKEVMLYYATLGDYPQYVSPVTAGGVDIRRFPISITLNDELNVVINYPALAFMTAENIKEYIETTVLPEIMGKAKELVDQHNLADATHQDIRNLANQLAARVGRIEDMMLNDITGNPYIVTFADLEGLVVEGVWNKALQRIEF